MDVYCDTDICVDSTQNDTGICDKCVPPLDPDVLSVIYSFVKSKDRKSWRSVSKHFRSMADDTVTINMKSNPCGARDLFSSAIQRGALRTATWLGRILEITPDDVRKNKNLMLRDAARYGHFNTVKWLVQTFGLTGYDIRSKGYYALRLAIANGHSKTAKWLVDRFCLTISAIRTYDNWAFRHAIANGNIKTARWVANRFNLTLRDVKSCYNFALRRASTNGHIYSVIWLVETFGLTIDDVRARDNIVNTAIMGEWTVVNWFHNKFILEDYWSIRSNTPKRFCATEFITGYPPEPVASVRPPVVPGEWIWNSPRCNEILHLVTTAQCWNMFEIANGARYVM